MSEAPKTSTLAPAHQPNGVHLLHPNRPMLLDWTFGSSIPDATIRTRAQLDAVSWKRDLFNTDGQSAFLSKFRDYPAGTPNDLHPISADHISLIGRSWMQGDADTEAAVPYCSAYLRPETQLFPGHAYVEVCAQFPTDPCAWCTAFGFPGMQKLGDPNQYYATGSPLLEIDLLDNFPADAAKPGATVRGGVVTSGPASLFGSPQTLYASPQGSPFASIGSGNGDVYVPDTAHNPTGAYFTYAMDWRDDNTIVTIFDGQVVSIRRVNYAALYSAAASTNYSINPPPCDLIGTMMPLFFQLTMQYGVTWNTKDLAALAARTGPSSAEYNVKWLRIWDSSAAGLH